MMWPSRWSRKTCIIASIVYITVLAGLAAFVALLYTSLQ